MLDQHLLQELGSGNVALGVDVRGGNVATEGWQKTHGLDLREFLRHQAALGLQWLVYTDISRDGMLGGIDSGAILKLKEATSFNIIASGGVSSLEDIKNVDSLGIWGLIVGKALYEGKFTLNQAQEILQ